MCSCLENLNNRLSTKSRYLCGPQKKILLHSSRFPGVMFGLFVYWIKAHEEKKSSNINVKRKNIYIVNYDNSLNHVRNLTFIYSVSW